MNFREQAQKFIEKEKQFHLGDLPTEKPHHLTINLSDRIMVDTEDGVMNLLEVDQDIIPVAKMAIQSPEYDKLIRSMLDCIKRGKTICFSSCGASGRLAIILEAMWRGFCQKESLNHPENSIFLKKLENQVCSIMTGGDRALIRSVENFEDYQIFGRQQFIDSGLGKGDMLIALGEGGEISSVIGTMKEALDKRSVVAMVYNNPPDILMSKFDRSRDVLTNPDIIKLNLTTGPMALAGSTRMQATTIAMLIIGAAIEECLNSVLNKDDKPKSRSYYTDQFENILKQLNNSECTKAISKLVDIESDCYRQSGRVTYVADQFLLDIFSDTTERAPTFMIPPFRQYDDHTSPVPWVFAKDPLRKSVDAWTHLLKRLPRGLNWLKKDYQKMGVPKEMEERADTLSNYQILKFHIGNENAPSRYECPGSVLLSISVNEPENIEFNEWCKKHGSKFDKSIKLTIGNSISKTVNPDLINIPIDFPVSNTMLFEHLAIKLIFNVFSTGTMAKIGRIKGNWMVQLDATNKKLTDRAIRVIAHFADIPYNEACIELFKTMSSPDTHRLKFENSYIIQTLERLGVEI